jgi:hypothetical protein
MLACGEGGESEASAGPEGGASAATGGSSSSGTGGDAAGGSVSTGGNPATGGNLGAAGRETGGSGGADASGGAGTDGAGAGGVGPDPNCTPSTLFGRTGELWKADGRLMNHGYAGYRTGTTPIPKVVSPSRSVSEFGAKANDDVDDTQAFLDAIDGTTSGVLTIPAGKFLITKRLEIKKPNFVLRGAGRGKTVLHISKSLSEVYGGDWSFGGGFISVQGSQKGASVGQVTKTVPRGSRVLELSSVGSLKVGQAVVLVQKDAEGTLLKALHDGHFPGDTSEDIGKEVFRFYTKVTAVSGKRVTLERPLAFPADTRWSPELKLDQPSVTEVGIEDLTIEFVGTKYPGHFNEKGYNGIALQNVRDCWVRNVEILNADYGVTLNHSRFSSVTDVVLDTNFDRGSLVGHHGLNSSTSQDLLFTRFDVKKKFVHDLTVDAYTSFTVWSEGKGVDLNMDHHGWAPTASLWTDLDLGAGTRPFASGGKKIRMPHSGSFSVFWNLRAAQPMKFPAADFGPLLTFVAFQSSGTPGASPYDRYVEALPNANLCTPNLHEAMLARRR